MRKQAIVGVGCFALVAGVMLVPTGAGGLAWWTNYSPSVSPTSVNVTCAAGASTGTASVTVSAVTPGSGGNTGTGGSFVRVTWKSGATTLGTVDLSSFNSPATMTNTAAPCPATSSQHLSGTVFFDARLSSSVDATGETDPTVTLTYNRVGSAS